MSLRRSTGSPRPCSGEMYPNLPLRMPAWVFEDWNPAVRLCPSGVAVFGVDLPRLAAAG